MLSFHTSWYHLIELASVVGFASVILIRLTISLYYLKRRPSTPSLETEIVHPYPIRTRVVYLTEREARLIGPILRNIAITFWISGLVTFMQLVADHCFSPAGKTTRPLCTSTARDITA